MIKRLKDAVIANELTVFFAKALIHFFQSTIDINRCVFLVYPSSQEGCWNTALLSALKSELEGSGYRHNTLEGLYRTYTVEKQHISGKRNLERQLNSIELRVPDISQFEFAIIVDDLTTSGTSFTAAETILRKNGFQGIIRNFAVAGTKSSFNKTLSTTKCYPRKRPLSTNAYIFDLDNTLVGSDNAKGFRDKEKPEWDNAIACIPNMKQFYCVVDAVKRLIQKDIDVAIVTSSTAEYCYRILQYLGITANDIVCVSFYDTKQHKPNPEPYLFAEKQFRHDNMNIFCIGDQMYDIIACDNARQQDPYHNYVPAFAFWNQGWHMQQSHTDNKLKVFFNEIQFLEFLGFIFPAKQSLYDLIHNYIRPTFVDLSLTDEQIYYMLKEKRYIDEQGYITEIGNLFGLSYSKAKNSSGIAKINLSYNSQLWLTGKMLNLSFSREVM